MPKPDKILQKATALQDRLETTLEPLNTLLQDLLEDDSAHLVHQPGDSWVICWGSGNNSLFESLDALLALPTGEAIAYLEARSL